MRSSIIAAAVALTFAMTAIAGPIPKDSIETTTKKCNKACTMDYKPICAQFKGGKKETFSNSCALSVYQCENPKEVVTTSVDGTCDVPAEKKCNKACTMDYKPICAQFKGGKKETFSNSCALSVYQCENPKEVVTTSVDGTCDAPAEKKCNMTCTMDYNPVCAQFDGGKKQTFGNSCSLSVYQCEHPEEILATASKGSCDAVATEEPKDSKLAAEITQPIETEAKSCNKACILLYDPVCAKFESGHSATFGNSCQLSVYQCENPRDKVAVTTKGSCEAL
ncbi:hypothetical protein EC968_009386 [Mortierella alpina]|nr:hypothetical protein EC968_009386 [Mortierella alpina]